MLTKTKAAIVTTLFLSLGAQADTILNVATAGDQNMVDYVKTWLGPKFEAAHPGVKVRVIGTGPGDAGSDKISEEANGPAGERRAAVGYRRRGSAPEGGR